MIATTERHSIVPAVWMIIRNSDDKIFLLRRANTGWRDGWWTVPAGHVEKNESPSQAAIRELKEEAGIDVKIEQLGQPLIHFYIADDNVHERVSLFFEVSTYEGTVHNAEPHKADKGEWFTIDELPEKTVPLLRRAIYDLSQGIRYSERYYDPRHRSELV